MPPLLLPVQLSGVIHYILSCLSYFTWHNVLTGPPCCSVYLNQIHFKAESSIVWLGHTLPIYF